MADSASVFTPLADDYARFRPGYPSALLDELARGCGLTSVWRVVDVGSGPGNLARLFLENGNPVTAVEPCREMREAGERLMGGYAGFTSVDGAAECVPLPDGCAEMVTVGQALHWFDVDRARAEFVRLLGPGGWVAVAWNDSTPAQDDFTREYRNFVSRLPAPPGTACAAPPLCAGVDMLFEGRASAYAESPHSQRFDLESFLGRARSSGYLPQPGEPGHSEIAEALTRIFQANQRDGGVSFNYIARLHYGRLG